MIVRTTKEWEKAVQAVLDSKDHEGVRVHSYDTETRDKGFPDIHVVGFSLGWYNADLTKGGCYVPLGHQKGLQLPHRAVLPGLKAILENPEIRTVMHNAPYDITVSRCFEEPVEIHENVDDTMVMAQMLNTNGIGSISQIETGNGLKGLKDLSEFYFGHKMTELTDLAPMEKEAYTVTSLGGTVLKGVREVMRVDLVSIEDLGAYAWDDGVQTLNLRELFYYGYDEYARRNPGHVRVLGDRFRALLRDVMVGMRGLPRVNEAYEKIEREFVFNLAEMQEMGITLDIDRILSMKDTVETERKELGGAMFAARPGQDFEPWLDSDAIRKCAEEYERLEQRYALGKDHPDYPTRIVTKSEGRGKEKWTFDVREPLPVGTARGNLFKAFGLDKTPIELKIRDDKVRPFVIEHPHLVHKIFNLNSGPQTAKVFFEECGCPILATSKKTDAPSTKSESIEEWAAMGYPVAKEMLRYREVDKLYGTYMVGMPLKVSAERLRTRFGRARTYRLTSSDPNLQNIPTSDEFPIREGFLADGVLDAIYTVHEWHLDDDGKPTLPKRVTCVAVEGNARGFHGGWEVDNGRVVRWWGSNPPWVMKVGDYSQLEICLLAHVSKDPILVEAVREGQDIHALTARAVFDAIPNDMSLSDVKRNFKKLRGDAKPVSFGVIYGMGPKTLAVRLDISIEEAEVIINDRYMGYYKGVAKWIDGRHAFVRKHGYVELATGHRRHLPEGMLDPEGRDPQTGDKYIWRIRGAERQAQNTPIQGFAAGIIGLAMRDTRRWCKRATVKDLETMRGENGEVLDGNGLYLHRNFARVCLQIHDELVSEVHPAIANSFMDRMVDMMEKPGGMVLRVPLRVDAALGANWKHTKS